MSTQTELNALKTITLKNIGLNIPVGGGEYLGKVAALVTGEVSGWFTKHTQYGESIALMGDFVVVNAFNGEVYEGGVAYFPADFAKTVVAKLEKAANGESILLNKLEIAVAKSEKASRGYAFVVRNMQTVEISNRKQAAARELMSHLKSLPKPEKLDTKKKAA